MTNVDRYIEALPKLRRFARAVTGSTGVGDDCVADVLSDLLEDKQPLPDGVNPVEHVFSLLTKNILKLDNNSAKSSSEAADDPLQRVTTRNRIALLLTVMEGFKPAEAARILEVSAEEFSAHLVNAEKEIEQLTASNILVIEDEAIIAMLLSDTVEEMGHTVIAQATTHSEAVTLASQHKPDIILADVQLADGSSGIEATTEILKSSDVPVIFITAYPERLLTGSGTEPAFMITKPFAPEMVKAVVSQALLFR